MGHRDNLLDPVAKTCIDHILEYRGYRFVKANRAAFPVAVMCRVLDLSTSGYYDWLHRKPEVVLVFWTGR